MAYRYTHWAYALIFSTLLFGCSSEDPIPDPGTEEGAPNEPMPGEPNDDIPLEVPSNGGPEVSENDGEDPVACVPAEETEAVVVADPGNEGDDSCQPPGFLSFFSVADSTLNEGVDMVANFYEVNQAITLDQIALSVEPVLDACTVSAISGGGSTTVARPVDLSDLSISDVYAGEVISVFSPAGSYAELTMTEGLDRITYENELGLLEPPAPRSLSYAVPGGVFPATMENIPIPDIEPLNWISPARDQPIGANATFSWTPDNDEASTIFLVLANLETVVACAVADDGVFQLPASIQSELGGFQSLGNVAIRFVYRIEQRGNTVDVTVHVAD